MSTYTRQSSFSDGDVIAASLLNNEYDAIVAEMHPSTGHRHDGTSGTYTPLIADTTGVTKIAVVGTDPATHQITFSLNGSVVLTWSAATPDVLLSTPKIEHNGGPLNTFLDTLVVTVGDASTYATASAASMVRAEAAAQTIGAPTLVADGGSFSIANGSAVADVVFLGDGTLNLPTTLVQGRRFTTRLSFSAASTKVLTIANPSYSLIGDKLTVAAGTDLLLAPGELVILESISTTQLEII